MKHLFYPVLLTAMLLSSCGHEEHSKEDAAATATPEALQDNSSEFSFKGRSSGLLDELYNELVEKDSGLKKMEDNLAHMKDAPEEAGKLRSFRQKNENYYREAEMLASGITDSVLRKQVMKMVRESAGNDSLADVPMRNLELRIEKNTRTIHDYHAVLTISKTLPVMEKYQSDNRLPLLPWQKFAKGQEDLLKEIKKNEGE
ncbi:MAG: hypothetical protein JWO09_1134 [Bacteroidetes bacterium]|nr:hypothetical protein [Bacteroidota bacterium]